MKVKAHAAASACDRERAREFDRQRAFANVDAGHAHARAGSLRGLPFRLRQDLMRDWIAGSIGGPGEWNRATRELNRRARWIKGAATVQGARATVARIEGRDELHAHSSDESVKAWARRRAGECGAIVCGLDEMEAYAAARMYGARWSVGEQGLKLPDGPRRGRSAWPFVARLCCSKWWRRAARVMLGRGIEPAEIDRGGVHRRAGVYLSDRNAERGKLAQKRNAQLLLGMDAENELGERVNLAELAAGSVSNPWVRFSEMMVTLKGLEQIARADAWSGLFVTWTLPSAYHARLSESCDANPSYAGHRPRAGQDRLQSLWARARASIHSWGERWFGLRVAEPHHDGTPHWHLLIWIRDEIRDRVIDLLRSLALEESPDEPGADRHRCKVEAIDERGAAGYLAKYVSKMTTGANIGTATERCADGKRREVGKPSHAAQRARWWASLHGIRQFQFFGIPPRGVWREARRMPDAITPERFPSVDPSQLEIFERVRASADQSDYAGHCRAMGGVAAAKCDRPVILLKRAAPGLNAYGEERSNVTQGLQLLGRVFQVHRPRFVVQRRKFGYRRMRQTVACRAEAVPVSALAIVTRVHEWVIKPSRANLIEGADRAPWTRVNNCNVPVPPDPFPDYPPDPEAESRPDWWGQWFPQGANEVEK